MYVKSGKTPPIQAIGTFPKFDTLQDDGFLSTLYVDFAL